MWGVNAKIFREYNTVFHEYETDFHEYKVYMHEHKDGFISSYS